MQIGGERWCEGGAERERERDMVQLDFHKETDNTTLRYLPAQVITPTLSHTSHSHSSDKNLQSAQSRKITNHVNY